MCYTGLVPTNPTSTITAVFVDPRGKNGEISVCEKVGSMVFVHKVAPTASGLKVVRLHKTGLTAEALLIAAEMV